MTIKEVKKGEYITLKPIEFPKANQVWIKGNYDRQEKKYEIYRFDDINTTRFIKATKEVYIGFTF